MVYPPDPSGAAGIDHYVQATNVSYRVFNKDGTAETPPLFLHTLFPGWSSRGDPIVMYDRYADRWFISQFHHDGNGNQPYAILIAVSETSDPLGSYYAYEFDSWSAFPDYPKFGVWSNCYLMTLNTTTTDCCVFERDKMLTGDPTASMIGMYFPNLTMQFPSLAPAYAEGLWAPEADAPAWAFAVQDDFMPGVSDDHIRIFKIVVDWDNPGNSDIIDHQQLTTSSFNGFFSWNWQDITQPGTSNKLDALAGFFMYKAQYRRFDGYDVIMLTHTVDADNTNRAGVRWYELRMDEGTDTWYINQESTYAPNDARSRWCGNAAMDLNGHIGLAYTAIGAGDYAGLRYTGRFDYDTPNMMTVQEQIAVDGEGFQDPGIGDNQSDARFGDYSQMTVDPVDDATFWFTGEYLGPSGNRRTRIFSFAMWELLGEEEPVSASPFFNSYQPSPDQLTVAWKDLKDNKFDIVLTDLNGKLVAQHVDVDASMGQKTFSVPAGASGIYLVSLRGENTELTDKVWFAQ